MTPTVSAVTEGVRVEVAALFLPEQSDISIDRYVFAYRITITNESDASVQLIRRHWIITEADGATREVEGEGVVGEQPTIKPGGFHEYTSGAVLELPSGNMQGTYQMQREDGSAFEARIPAFELTMPRTLH